MTTDYHFKLKSIGIILKRHKLWKCIVCPQLQGSRGNECDERAKIPLVETWNQEIFLRTVNLITDLYNNTRPPVAVAINTELQKNILTKSETSPCHDMGNS